MFWAACNLAYFRLLHYSEFTAPNMANFSEDTHFSVVNVTVDSSESPTFLHVHLKASKTDPFCQGCYIHIAEASFLSRPSSPFWLKLHVRRNKAGPLFLFKDGTPLSCARLTDWLQRTLSAAADRQPTVWLGSDLLPLPRLLVP